MLKKSMFWRTMYNAWDLICDYRLPAVLRPEPERENFRNESFNVLYALPLWGAAAGIIALILWKIFNALLPVNGAALLLAFLLVAAGELRCRFRALALCVTFMENIFYGKKFVEAQALRRASLKDAAGVIPMLLTVGALGGKFLAVFLVVRAGHSGTAGCAMVAALTVEALLAADPAAENMPQCCNGAKSEYILITAGFLLLFNLLALPLPTLISCGVCTVIVIGFFNAFLRRSDRITSDDMTMTGYFAELTIWLVTAVMIG